MLSFESDMHIVQCIILNMPSRKTHQSLAIKRNWGQLGNLDDCGTGIPSFAHNYNYPIYLSKKPKRRGGI